MLSKTPSMIVLPLLITGLLLVTGCQRTLVTDPLNVNYTPDNIDAEMAFWTQLPDKRIISNDEAIHALIVFADDTDPHQSYDARVAALKEKGWLSGDFDRPANEAVSRGTVAQILCHVLDIQGGLTMRLLGPVPRYAVRELIYLRIMMRGTQQQGLSGIQLAGIMSRAESYQEDNG